MDVIRINVSTREMDWNYIRKQSHLMVKKSADINITVNYKYIL